MLLEFRMKNYKSFREEVVFSMIPAPKQKGLDYSVFSKVIDGVEYKGLPSAVVYGPNASGKTNLFGAMDTFRQIVKRGNINNSDSITSPNHAAFALELIPNRQSRPDTTVLGIKFIDRGFLFEYSIEMDLGAFLDKDYKRRIVDETLLINGKRIFSRKKGLSIEIPKTIEVLLNPIVRDNAQIALEIAQSGLNDTDLFLTNGFKTVYSLDLSFRIQDWIDKKFIIIYRSDAVNPKKEYNDAKDNTVYIEKTISAAATEFGSNSNALGFKSDNEQKEMVLCSIFKDRHIAIPAELFESYGTIRLVRIFPLIVHTLSIGGTLIMDEFDASIHPMAVMNIINIFHNDEINKNHAQLVFNTHNPIFLNSNLFRRDEIKFVERDDLTHDSSHYSLSDFKTSGENGVRLGADYLKNYFIGQYGAVKDVDFAPIIEQFFKDSEAKKHERKEV